MRDLNLVRMNQYGYARTVERLKDIRTKYKYSQETIAHMMGVTKQTIFNFEKNTENMNLNILFMYMNVLGITNYDEFMKDLVFTEHVEVK